MTDYMRAKTARNWMTPASASPSVASNPNVNFIWPSVRVIGGLIVTFVWVAFLAWCLWSLVVTHSF